MRSRSEYLDQLPSITNSSLPEIATQTWITADRPASLAGSVRTFLNQASQSGRRPAIIVCDDSSSASAEEANRGFVEGLAAEGHEARFLGSKQRRRLADVLISELPVASAEIEFALYADPLIPGPRIGANRNLALLASAGEPALMTDDDTFCRAVRPFGMEGPLHLSSDYLRARIDPAPSREDLWAHREPLSEDYLGHHESLLGRHLGELLSSETSMEWMSPRLVSETLSHGGVVRATGTGVIGDLGSDSPKHLLSLEPPNVEPIVSDPSRYAMAKESRELVRCGASPILTKSAFLGGFFLGLDGRVLLPPFVPVGRNEDIMFATMLSLVRPEALIGHLPIAYSHEPQPRRFFSTGTLFDVMPKSNELLPILIALSQPAEPGEPADRMREMGERMDRATASPAEFTSAMREWWVRSALVMVRRMDATVEAYGSDYPHWADDLEAASRSFQQLINEPEQISPSDFVGTSDGRFETLRCLGVRLAALLDAWPRIVETARGLASTERG